MQKTRLSKLFKQFQALNIIFLSALLLSCAGSSPSPDIQCPQPRFTGQAPATYLALLNPVADQVDAIAAGKALYQESADPACRLCHGRKGDGMGPLASQFSVPPRNFACAATIKGIPDGQLFWIIENGSPDTNMDGFKHLNEVQIWQLVSYIRQLGDTGGS